MDIQQQKEENNFIESQQKKLVMGFIKQQRERFDFADTMHWIALTKKEEDFLVLCDSFTKWILQLKANDKRKEELTELLQSVWRLQSYCVNIETIIQTSVSNYISIEKRNKDLVSEKKTLELKNLQKEKLYQQKIEELEKEIEFISNNGKP